MGAIERVVQEFSNRNSAHLVKDLDLEGRLSKAELRVFKAHYAAFDCANDPTNKNVVEFGDSQDFNDLNNLPGCGPLIQGFTSRISRLINLTATTLEEQAEQESMNYSMFGRNTRYTAEQLKQVAEGLSKIMYDKDFKKVDKQAEAESFLDRELTSNS